MRYRGTGAAEHRIASERRSPQGRLGEREDHVERLARTDDRTNLARRCGIRTALQPLTARHDQIARLFLREAIVGVDREVVVEVVLNVAVAGRVTGTSGSDRDRVRAV